MRLTHKLKDVLEVLDMTSAVQSLAFMFADQVDSILDGETDNIQVFITENGSSITFTRDGAYGIASKKAILHNDGHIDIMYQEKGKYEIEPNKPRFAAIMFC